MADFRKLILVLAVLVAVAVPVSAQTTFSCATTPAVPQLIRASGITELVGAVELQCSGGTAETNAAANIQVFMTPTVVTNRGRQLERMPWHQCLRHRRRADDQQCGWNRDTVGTGSVTAEPGARSWE